MQGRAVVAKGVVEGVTGGKGYCGRATLLNIVILGYLVDSITRYILCVIVLAGTGSRFTACSTSR